MVLRTSLLPISSSYFEWETYTNISKYAKIYMIKCNLVEKKFQKYKHKIKLLKNIVLIFVYEHTKYTIYIYSTEKYSN